MSKNNNLILKEKFTLAVQNQQKGNFEVAKNLYNKILEVEPSFIDAQSNLGNIFKELGENQKAISCYEKAIEIDPNILNAHNNLGVLFKELGENQRSNKLLQKSN